MLSWHCCGFVLATVVLLISPARISAYKCTKLREIRCRNLGYNRTIEPNMFGHRDQKAASVYLNDLQPLINVECFSHMTDFLCSVLFPICTNWKERVKPIPPCRSFCLDAKAGCESIMNKFGFKWPKVFDCTRFPLSTANELCIYKNETTTQAKTVQTTTQAKTVLPTYKCTKLREKRCRNLGYDRTIEPNMFGHRDQKAASVYLNEWQPLIKVGCFSHMTDFLCSVLFPICTNGKERVKPIPPCRSLCLDAKAGCEGILNRFGYKWPKGFDCTRFPLSTANELCIYKNETTTQAKTVLPNVPIKQLRKICWENSNSTTKATRANKRCCRQGNRAAKIRSGTCSMPKLVAKHWSRKKKKSAKKTNKMCSKGVSKACYKACCEYKKKQNKNKARKSRKRRP